MEDIYVVGHKSPDTDSVASAIVYAGIKGYKAAVAGELNPETVFVLSKFGVKTPEIFANAEGKKVILVDHNETSQMADDKSEVVGVVDHHKLSMSVSKPISVRVEPVGATATIVAGMYMDEVKANPAWAGLLLSAILSDTVIFKSPTTTEEDRVMAVTLADVCGIKDPVAYGIEMKKVNASIVGKDIRSVIGADFKDFEMGGKKVGIGAVEVVDMSEVAARKGEILSRLTELKGDGYEMVIFAATDIINEGSELFFAGDKALIEKAFGVQIGDSASVYIKGLMSRKKQIVPPLEEAYKNI
ncbi:MAG: manganese-dependent inorganic pyrophosphatase [Candidatus Colwellbacteria bacterium]|nr:manganese-dependent inorganic pyrophosphatase [Candidatus Colwellbacteria bacterium]